MPSFKLLPYALNRCNSFKKKRHLDECLISPACTGSNKENCCRRNLIILSLISLFLYLNKKKIRMVIPTFRVVWKQANYTDMIEIECQSPYLPLITMLKYIFSHPNSWLTTSPEPIQKNQAHYHFVGSYISLLIIMVKVSQGK